MAGVRISFPQGAREAYESGRDFKYVDGELAYVEPEEGFGSIEVYHVAKLLQLSAALDYRKYYSKEMLQKSMFLMGDNDEAVGPPSDNEINYFIKNDVKHTIVKEGGHRSMMKDQYLKKVRNFIRE